MDEAEYCNRLALMYAGKVIALGAPAELKRELKEHNLLRLDTAAPLDTMRAIEHEEGILEVAVFGSGLHVVVDDVEASMAPHPASASARRGIAIAAPGADRAFARRRVRGADRGRGKEGGHELPAHPGGSRQGTAAHRPGPAQPGPGAGHARA